MIKTKRKNSGVRNMRNLFISFFPIEGLLEIVKKIENTTRSPVAKKSERGGKHQDRDGKKRCYYHYCY